MKIVSFVLVASMLLMTTTPAFAEDETVSRAECSEMGEVIGDPGDGSVSMNANYVCENGQPPIAVIVPAPDEPIASEGEVCCGLEVAGPVVSSPMDLPDDIPLDQWQTVEFTRQECEAQSGSVIGDPGDGSVSGNPDYICENTLPPIGVIVPAEGEPISFEGEICCGPPIMEVTSHSDSDLPTGNDTITNPNVSVMTEQECLDVGGEIVGDAGDGAIFQEDYKCNSNDEPPLGMVVPAEEDQVTATGRASAETTSASTIPVEGSVCCATGSDTTDTNETTSDISSSSRISLVVGATAVPALAWLIAGF